MVQGETACPGGWPGRAGQKSGRCKKKEQKRREDKKQGEEEGAAREWEIRLWEHDGDNKCIIC